MDNNKILPNEYYVFALSRDKSPSEVTLRSAEWAIITQIDGQKTVGEIANILAMSYEEAINYFVGLYDVSLLRLITTRKSEKHIVPDSFFETLENELTRIIGPVAPYLIDDTLWNLDLIKENFIAEKVPQLIEAISDEIPDEEKRIAFQQVMLELIKELKLT